MTEATLTETTPAATTPASDVAEGRVRQEGNPLEVTPLREPEASDAGWSR